MGPPSLGVLPFLIPVLVMVPKCRPPLIPSLGRHPVSRWNIRAVAPPLSAWANRPIVGGIPKCPPRTVCRCRRCMQRGYPMQWARLCPGRTLPLTEKPWTCPLKRSGVLDRPPILPVPEVRGVGVIPPAPGVQKT